MLVQRIITALLLVTVFSLLLFFSSYLVWDLTFVALAGLMAWEWSSFAKLNTIKYRLIYAIIVVNTTMGIFIFSLESCLLLTSPLLLIVMIMAVVCYQKNKANCKYTTSNPIILIVGIWAIISFSIAVIYFKQILTPWEILLCMMSIWAIDTGAYFTGKKLGKNKLCTNVSPSKTWEGVLGGGITAVLILVVGVLLINSGLNLTLVVFIILATVIALLSVFGDLFQSLLKRQVNLKDSGSILPGHGGVLDRLDSLIIGLPLFYILWLWYLP